MSSQVSIPAAVLGLQGALNIVFGSFGIIRPGEARSQMAATFGGVVPAAAAHTLSLQLVNMGVFTVFAASRRSLHRRALIARMCIHLLTGYIFWREGGEMVNLAMVDTGFAVMNAITMFFLKDSETD